LYGLLRSVHDHLRGHDLHVHKGHHLCDCVLRPDGSNQTLTMFLLVCLFHFARELRHGVQGDSSYRVTKPKVAPLQFEVPKSAMKKHYDVAA